MSTGKKEGDINDDHLANNLRKCNITTEKELPFNAQGNRNSNDEKNEKQLPEHSKQYFEKGEEVEDELDNDEEDGHVDEEEKDVNVPPIVKEGLVLVKSVLERCFYFISMPDIDAQVSL